MLGDRRSSVLMAVLPVFAGVAACDAGESSPAPPPPARPRPPALRRAAPPAVPSFPQVALEASPGAHVLSPAPSSIDDGAFPGSLRAMPFYAARLLSVGADVSRIESPVGHQADVPNALIVPLRPGEHAAPGEMVLSAWATGAGLKRAIVVSGPEHAPGVRYLDATPFGTPLAPAPEDRVEFLAPGTFQRILLAGDVGGSLACGDRRAPEHFILLRKHEAKLLALGHADRVAVFDRADCSDVPLRPKLSVGARVQVPLFGRFQTVRVKRLEPALGRVTAGYDGPAGPSSAVFSWLDVLPQAVPE